MAEASEERIIAEMRRLIDAKNAEFRLSLLNELGCGSAVAEPPPRYSSAATLHDQTDRPTQLQTLNPDPIVTNYWYQRTEAEEEAKLLNCLEKIRAAVMAFLCFVWAAFLTFMLIGAYIWGDDSASSSNKTLTPLSFGFLGFCEEFSGQILRYEFGK